MALRRSRRLLAAIFRLDIPHNGLAIRMRLSYSATNLSSIQNVTELLMARLEPLTSLHAVDVTEVVVTEFPSSDSATASPTSPKVFDQVSNLIY
jgi:hypothetical protein